MDNPNKFSEMKLLYSKLTSSKSAPGLTDRSSLALERLTVAVAFFTCVLSSAEIYNILKDWLIAPSVTSMLAAVSLLLTLVLLLAVYAAFEIMRSKK